MAEFTGIDHGRELMAVRDRVRAEERPWRKIDELIAPKGPVGALELAEQGGTRERAARLDRGEAQEIGYAGEARPSCSCSASWTYTRTRAARRTRRLAALLAGLTLAP